MSRARDEYTAKVKQQLDEFNRRMDALEGKADAVRAELRESYRQELVKLHQHAELAADTFQQVRAAGSASWNRLVEEMDRAGDAFSDALERFKSKF